MKPSENSDKTLLWGVCLSIVAVVLINFITSYQHIYDEGLRYGEYGVDARLMPIGIDGMLLALGLGNVFASRILAKLEKKHRFGSVMMRLALAFGVAGTVAVNGAYGATWGRTGGLLATWSPLALFIAVEAGLFAFKINAEYLALLARPKRGRPSKTAPQPTVPPTKPSAEVAIPIIRGTRVVPTGSFEALRDNAA